MPLRPPRSTVRKLTSPEVARLQSFIDRNLTRRLTLAALAGEMSVSVSHLNRLIRNTFGRRPCEYVTVRRVEHAKDLMRRLGPYQASLAEIATRCGFADQSHFSKQFKRITHMTPRQFCESLRAEE
jgi:AraC family transcriptional regulator